MITSIHQPTYLPYIGFFNKILHSECYVVYDTAQYVTRAFNNRNKIKVSTGTSAWLTVPLKKASYRPFIEMMIDHAKPWKENHWKSILLNYSKAKCFQETCDRFEMIYTKDYENLADINVAIIREILDMFDYKGRIEFASKLHLSGKTRATDTLIEILKKVGAEYYLSGPSGKQYMDEDIFRKESIKIIYQHFSHPIYNQLWGAFQPNMCILDVLFNEGISKSKRIVMNEKVT